MKNPRAYKTYFGGKAGNGTYQTIINNIPAHRFYVSLFLGNDAVYRFMKRADYALLNDIDPAVIQAWHDAGFKDDYRYWMENRNALDILHSFNANDGHPGLINDEEVFIFLDPPYLLDSRKSSRPVYKFEMSLDEHARLLDIITSSRMEYFKVMICCYPNDFYSIILDKLPNWRYVDYQSMTRNGLAWERIYMNYPQPTELQDYRYIGGNFRQRERIKRITTNLFEKLEKLEPVHRNAIISDIVERVNELK